jgi:hypothetical protein
MIDVVRVGADDAWLLTTNGVFRWDSCAWRLQPSRDLAGRILAYLRLVVDAHGTVWVRGHQPPGPPVSHGCVVEPSFPGRDVGFRFDGARWEPVDPALVPIIEPAPVTQVVAPGPERTVRVVSGDARDRWAIIEVTHNEEVRPGGWGMYHWTELWRQRDGRWAASLATPYWLLHPEPRPVRELIIERGIDRSVPARAFGTPDLWMHGRDDIWTTGAFGTSGSLGHFDGIAWHDLALAPGAIVNAVFGAARDDVWAGGDRLWHFDGTAWSEVRNDDMFVRAIGGSSARDIWTIGYHTKTVMPEIRHWDGTRWAAMAEHLPSKTQYHLTAVLSTGPGDAWVLGERGTILHWDGTRWAEVPPPALLGFRGAAIEAGELWLGDGYSIYRHVGSLPR